MAPISVVLLLQQTPGCGVSQLNALHRTVHIFCLLHVHDQQYPTVLQIRLNVYQKKK